MKDRIILILIALFLIIGVIEALKVGKNVEVSQDAILENQRLLKETLKLHDQHTPKE